MKYLIIITILFGIFGCCKNTEVNTNIIHKSENKLKIDSIDSLIYEAKIDESNTIIYLTPQ